MNSQAVNNHDRDSLVALDALLRIRESGALNSIIANGSSLKSSSSELASSNRESIASCSPSSLQTHLAARLSSLLPMNAASVLFSNSNQQNAVLAATAAHLRMAAATNWGNGLLAAGNAHSMSSGVSPSLNSTPAIAGTPRPRHESFDLQSTVSSPEKKVESPGPQSASIRKEKVAEALRSKPQRGRKRDDLSETERLELTRTRNREHAKSTRIRKKARYQELLDREEMYLQQQEQEDIEVQKRNDIQQILSLRQDMLREEIQLQARNQQSGETSSSRTRSLEGTRYQAVFPYDHFRSLLAELIEPASSFEFDSLLPGDVNADSDEAISKMHEWDEALVDRASCTFTSNFCEVLPSITYEIESGCDGIALNKNGDAFCRVEIFVQVPSPFESDASASVAFKKTKIMSGICSFQFGSMTNRLTSMRWTTLEDCCSRACSSVKVEGSNRPFPEYLQSQLVHPSVVSLDHVKQNEGDDNHGPGMNI